MSGTDYVLFAHLNAQEQYQYLDQQSIHQQKAVGEMFPSAIEDAGLSNATAIYFTADKGEHYTPREVNISNSRFHLVKL